MASIPYKQPGTMQLAVQLGGALFISYTFGLLINSGREMPVMLPSCPHVLLNKKTVYSGNMQGP